MEKLKYKNMLWTELLCLKKYSACGFFGLFFVFTNGCGLLLNTEDRAVFILLGSLRILF